MTKKVDFSLRAPVAADGQRIWRLVGQDSTLELNSAYCYVLMCSHFAASGAVAERDDELAGFVTAYRPPSDPQALFVWQVGVSDDVRGQGLGSALLDFLVTRPSNRTATYLTATVASDNEPSKKLFASFARRQGCSLDVENGYPSSLFPDQHPAEPLLRIGPLDRSQPSLPN